MEWYVWKTEGTLEWVAHWDLSESMTFKIFVVIKIKPRRCQREKHCRRRERVGKGKRGKKVGEGQCMESCWSRIRNLDFTLYAVGSQWSGEIDHIYAIKWEENRLLSWRKGGTGDQVGGYWCGPGEKWWWLGQRSWELR